MENNVQHLDFTTKQRKKKTKWKRNEVKLVDIYIQVNKKTIQLHNAIFYLF